MTKFRTLADLGGQEQARERVRAYNSKITERTSGMPRTERQQQMSCEDCTGFSEPYMLTSEVWAEIHPSGKRGMVCLDCAERRLGRPLVLEDFSSAVVNLPILVGYGMGLAAKGDQDA